MRNEIQIDDFVLEGPEHVHVEGRVSNTVARVARSQPNVAKLLAKLGAEVNKEYSAYTIVLNSLAERKRDGTLVGDMDKKLIVECKLLPAGEAII